MHARCGVGEKAEITSKPYLSLSTINYGSILQMFCVDIQDNFTMAIPLQVLRTMAADFDKYLCQSKTYRIAGNW